MKYFILLILLTVTHSYSQLIVVEKNDIENDRNLTKNHSLISYIDNNSALLVGDPNSLNDHYNLKVIDSSWQKNMNYYLLLKRGGIDNLPLISQNGRILYNTTHSVIYKTKIATLNEYPEFYPYDIIKIHNRSILRTRNDPLQINSNNREFSSKVNEYVQSIEIDSIWDMIYKLQNMERYTYSSASSYTADTISNILQSFNFDTLYQDDYLSSGSPNIIAQKKGTENPDKIIIVCSHYDVSRSGYPGADDNGSGSSGTLEIARILKDADFKNTLRFVLFSGEENGLLGSQNYAQKVSNLNENIIAVFNLDMIGYLKPGDPLYLDVVYDNQSQPLYENFVNLAYEYLPEISICDAKNSPWKNSSDHKSFWDKNYSALYFGDDLDPAGPENPHYHTLGDSLGSGVNSKDYLEGVVKTVAASVITLGELDLSTDKYMIKTELLNMNGYELRVHKKQLIVNSQTKNSKNATVKIFTLNGQQIFSTTIKSSSIIDLSKYSKGSYFVEIKSNIGKIQKRIAL